MLHQMAIKPFSIPGDSSWGLGGMYPPPKSGEEGEGFKAYFKQCREEIGIRMLDVLYLPDGSKNKWWQSFSKRKVRPRQLPRCCLWRAVNSYFACRFSVAVHG